MLLTIIIIWLVIVDCLNNFGKGPGPTAKFVMGIVEIVFIILLIISLFGGISLNHLQIK